MEKTHPTTPNYTKILNRIFIALIIMIVLLLVNIILTVISLGEFSETETNNTNETSATEYDTSMFTEITPEEYKNLYNKDEYIVTYFGRSTCGYCIQFLPSVQKAQSEYGFKTYYVDIDKVDQNGANTIYALDERFANTLGSTPMMTITKNGKLIDMLVGYTSYEAYVDFLKNNGAI